MSTHSFDHYQHLVSAHASLLLENQEKELFLEGLLNNLPVILYRISPEGIITMSKGAGLSVVPGWSNDQLIGIDAFDLAKDISTLFKRAQQGQISRGINSFSIEGQDFHFDTIVMPDRLQPGGVIGFAVDITAAKRAEAKIVESYRKIEEQSKRLSSLNSFKDRILSIISHDLRQPFSSIVMASQLLEFAGPSITEEELRSLFLKLKDTALKGIDLLEGLLTWVTSEKEGYVFQSQPIGLRDNISEANGLYNGDQEARNITLKNNIPEGLFVNAHNQMLLFINRNLISNATKYSPDGGNIYVSATVFKDKVTVSYQDEGPGLTEEKKEDLFKITFDSAKTNDKEGAGIALTICRDLISKMNGKLWVSPRKDKGAEFCYTIPLVV